MKCEHEIDWSSAQIYDVLHPGGKYVIVDIWCSKCGKSGAAKIVAEDVMFDEEDEDGKQT